MNNIELGDKLMKSIKLFVCLSIIATIDFACTAPAHRGNFSDEAESNQMRKLAARILPLAKLDRVERAGSQYNFVAIKFDGVLLSRRLDSRTYYVHDERYGKMRPAGVFEGPDQQIVDFGKDLFRKLNIPLSEISAAVVLQENIQVARVDTITGVIEYEEPEKGQKLAKFRRSLEGLPVFSSSITLGLIKNMEIGFMELHWPEIPPHVIIEAHRLEFKVEQGWRPPEQKGAKVESVEAGIIHSAAPGFLMDIYPSIRVVYMSEEQGVGRKLTLHFDRHGNTIPIPREFDIPCPEEIEPRKR